MIDDNFREISVKNHLEGMDKLVEGSNWEKPTKLNISNNLVEKIADLLTGKITRSTLVNSRGEVKQRIIIEYD